MEILVPVGNSIRLIRDVLSEGADAVYFGIRPPKKKERRYSLLWAPFEFDLDSAAEAIRILNDAGKRSYITLNVPYPEVQINDVLDLACRVYDAGASAVIVGDPGFAALLKERRPEGEIHASIMGRTVNSETAAFWKEIGAERVILERVLTREEVIAIKQRAGVDVEVFVYGNFCFFYHGVCRISSYFYGEMCMAPCMDPLEIDGLDAAAPRPFRSKSLNAYDSLPELFSAGVSSIKIEGRQKSRKYILNALRVFRRAVDALKKGDPLPDPPKIDLLFPVPPCSTPGFFSGPPVAHETVDTESGRQELRRQLAVYMTPSGVRIALDMKKKKRKAFRNADRLSRS